jgi:hypothetical protein
MVWVARLLLIIPALITGWFVSKEDPRFWVVAMAIALVFVTLTCLVAFYVPPLRVWPRRRER